MSNKTYEVVYYNDKDEWEDSTGDLPMKNEAIDEAKRWLVDHKGRAEILCKTVVAHVERDLRITVK